MATRPAPRWIIYVVPLLLVAVAALGTWRHRHDDQTAWRGGTVGMFAVVDSPANRLVRGLAAPDESDGPLVVLMPPASIDAVHERAKVRPTDANLGHLADEWEPLVGDGKLVRVEVWATRFDSEGTTVRLELLSALDLASAET